MLEKKGNGGGARNVLKMNCRLGRDYSKVIDVLFDPLGRCVLNLRLFLDTWFLLVNKSLLSSEGFLGFFGACPKLSQMYNG